MRENEPGRAHEMLETVATRMGIRQSLARDRNEHAKKSRPRSTFFEYACECASEACDQLLPLTAAEYNDVRSAPTQFVVATGHVNPRVEAVVRETPRYEVVQKFGAAATAASR